MNTWLLLALIVADGISILMLWSTMRIVNRRIDLTNQRIDTLRKTVGLDAPAPSSSHDSEKP